ncbi:hypothetical protein E5D57_000058 [Metarhizium anisopliae]|nr:hypothetical protein E5D57_000058 [Metarhizium anisopliae]
MAHKRLNFGHLRGRDLRVNRELVRSFDRAVNSNYDHEDFGRCFYYSEDIIDADILASEHVAKVQFAQSWTMNQVEKTNFEKHASSVYRRSGTRESFSATILRLASCVPYNHPGQECLLQVLKGFLHDQHTTGSRDNAQIIFKETLSGFWGFLIRADEWANLNAFVAMIYRDLGDDDYAGLAVKGISLALLNGPESVDAHLTMDLRALIASAWIQHCGGQLLALVFRNSQGSAENDAVLHDISDATRRLNKHTWIKMVENFRITIGEARNEFTRDTSRPMCYWMEQRAQQCQFMPDQNTVLLLDTTVLPTRQPVEALDSEGSILRIEEAVPMHVGETLDRGFWDNTIDGNGAGEDEIQDF